MAMKPSLKETIMKSLSTPIFIEAAVLLSLSLAGPMSAWADVPQHHDQVPGFHRLDVGDLVNLPGAGRLRKDGNAYSWAPILFTDQWIPR